MYELLALIPIIHFVLLFTLSDKTMRGLLMKNYAVMYLDWLFVPFNLLIASSLNFSWSLFSLFFVVAILLTFFLHWRWQRIHNKPVETKLFFSDHGMTLQGWIHFGFMSVQSAIVLAVFFSPAISSSYFWMLALLLVYCAAFLFIIVFVRKVRLLSKVEAPFILLGFVLIVLRMILLLSSS